MDKLKQIESFEELLSLPTGIECTVDCLNSKVSGIEGKLFIIHDRAYFCSNCNKLNGSSSGNNLGFGYSWEISNRGKNSEFTYLTFYIEQKEEVIDNYEIY